jgi:hypothetical protein
VTWWKFWDRPCPRNRRRDGSEVEAQRRLDEVQKQQPTVARLSAELEARHGDSFAAAFVAAMRGERR